MAGICALAGWMAGELASERVIMGGFGQKPLTFVRACDMLHPGGTKNMVRRKCPVCHGVVLRRDVQTCGAGECVDEWKSWGTKLRAKARIIADMTPAQHAQYLEDQAAENKLFMRGDEATESPESTESPGAMPESLAKLLGEKSADPPALSEQPLSEQEQREIRRKQMAEVLLKQTAGKPANTE